MCMYYDKGLTTRLRKKMEAAGGMIVCWKAYAVKKYQKSPELLSPYQWEAPGGKVQKPGHITSNRSSQAAGADYLDTHCPGGRLNTINRGIHVYRSKQAAKEEWGGHVTLVPVQCRLSDFVGAGLYGEAIFTKVRILRADFDAATK